MVLGHLAEIEPEIPQNLADPATLCVKRPDDLAELSGGERKHGPIADEGDVVVDKIAVLVEVTRARLQLRACV